MRPKVQSIIQLFYALIVLGTAAYLTYTGYSFYWLPMEERFYHPGYDWLKPSGLLGHGLGITGTILILTGIITYWSRKRYRIFADLGLLKNWLEFHIFLCTLGTIMVVFHSSFKFGGIIAIGFWSLIVVFLSGIVGRYIYLQIPKTIEGEEMTIHEIEDLRSGLEQQLLKECGLDCKADISRSTLNASLLRNKVKLTTLLRVNILFTRQMMLARKIRDLDRMKRIFRYWHVVHMPFALIMLLLMVIHVGVVVYFGYTWIL